MRVYWLVAILAFIIQFVRVKDDKQYWWRTVISFIPLFLFMALRLDYGYDESGYHEFFDRVHHAQNIYSVNDHMEYGYVILNKIMPNYQILIAFTSFITCWAYSYLVYRFVPQKYSWLAVLLLFLNPGITVFFMISGIRNGIAASLLILGCYYIERKKIIPYVLLGAVAMSIHTSALLMFALCYFVGTNKSIEKREMLIWIGVILFAATASLSAIANGLMPVIEIFMGKYVEQVEGTAEIADERGFIGALVGIAFAVSILYYNMTETNAKKHGAVALFEHNSLMKYKLALIYAASFSIGMLGARMEQYMIYYFITAVVGIFAYSKNIVLKYGLLLIVLYFFWTTYKDWIGNPFFKYQIYTSILGDF